MHGVYELKFWKKKIHMMEGSSTHPKARFKNCAKIVYVLRKNKCNTWHFLPANSKHRKNISSNILNIIGTTFFLCFLPDACHLKNGLPGSRFFIFLDISTGNHKINQD